MTTERLKPRNLLYITVFRIMLLLVVNEETLNRNSIYRRHHLEDKEEIMHTRLSDVYLNHEINEKIEEACQNLGISRACFECAAAGTVQ